MRANEVENSLRLGHIPRIDMAAQAEPMFAIEHVAETDLPQVVSALLVMPALGQLVTRVGAGDIGVEVGGVVS